MATPQYDVLVIGGGPGGYTAAIRASRLGMKAAVVERDRLGGVCLNWGCIPTKALLRNAEILHTIQHADEWGISVGPVRVDFAGIIKRSRSVSDKVSKGVEYLMRKNSIEVLHGTARLLSASSVEITPADGKPRQVSAKHIIIATGARPRSIPGVPIDRQKVISSTEAMNLPALPASLIVIGAGAIGVEFAYFYNTLGTKVTIVEMMSSILPIEDAEVTKQLTSSLKKQGIEILTGAKVEKVVPGDKGVKVTVAAEGGSTTLEAERALMAVGVQGNVENLGLEGLGVTVDRGHIKVDTSYRTSVAGVYAIGDVIGPPWLAHVASAEGIHCVETIAGLSPGPLDYQTIPGCTYCQPQVASVGLTEEKAKAAGHELAIGRFPFRPLGKAMATGETEGFVKLIFDKKYGELLGAHILGAGATEMIAELVVAKRLEATGKDLLRAVHAHPTLSEAVMEAAAVAYGEAINI